LYGHGALLELLQMDEVSDHFIRGKVVEQTQQALEH
jgi:hypothetical protein